LRKAGGSRDRSVMVGDSQTDIAAARATGVPVVGVDFGYTEVPMARLGPDRIISDFSALSEVVAEIMEPGVKPGAFLASTPVGSD
jgi:phosphoglycolate phosphatase